MKRVWTHVVAAALLSITSAAFAQQYTLRVASPTINDFVQAWSGELKTALDKRTNSRIKVEHYPASQLGSMPTTLDGISLGTLEVAIATVGFLIPFDARFQILDAPGLYDDVDHARRIFTDPAMRKQLMSYAQGKGMQTLWVAGSGDMAVVSRKPIRTLADFKGMKLRVTGSTPFYVDPLKKLGASPIALSLGDVVPGIQTGTIDGAVAGINFFPFVKYYEVAKYSTLLPRNIAVVSAVISTSFLKQIGPELSAIVLEESIKAEDVLYERAKATDKLGKEIWVKNGELIKLNEVDSKAYLEAAGSVVSTVLAAQPQVKADYDRLVATSERTRR